MVMKNLLTIPLLASCAILSACAITPTPPSYAGVPAREVREIAPGSYYGSGPSYYNRPQQQPYATPYGQGQYAPSGYQQQNPQYRAANRQHFNTIPETAVFPPTGGFFISGRMRVSVSNNYMLGFVGETGRHYIVKFADLQIAPDSYRYPVGSVWLATPETPAYIAHRGTLPSMYYISLPAGTLTQAGY